MALAPDISLPGDTGWERINLLITIELIICEIIYLDASLQTPTGKKFSLDKRKNSKIAPPPIESETQDPNIASRYPDNVNGYPQISIIGQKGRLKSRRLYLRSILLDGHKCSLGIQTTVELRLYKAQEVPIYEAQK